MGKKQRNIIIVVVSVLGVLMIASLFPFLFQMVKNFAGNEPTIITELNQPYEGGGLRITVTDIHAVKHPEASDKINIEVYWVFENISNKEKYVNDARAKAYVDDISAPSSYSLEHYRQGIENDNLAAGKRTEGYYCVEAPKDARQFELRYYEEYSAFGVNVAFVFGIPPVEE